MKILLISHFYFPENFRINDLAAGLNDIDGVEITVLTGLPNYPDGEFFSGYSFFSSRVEYIKGIKVVRARVFPRMKSSKFSLALNFLTFPFFAIFEILLLKGPFDKIFVYAPSPLTVAIPGIFAKYKFGVDSFLWVHDLWPESVKVAGGINNKYILYFINIWVNYIYKKFDKILVQSYYFIPYLSNRGIQKSKMIYYPYFAEDLYSKPNFNFDSNLPHGVNIVFAGNIGFSQNLEGVLHAFSRLILDYPNVNLVLYGSGRNLSNIISLANELDLNRNVFFKGVLPVDQISKVYFDADALLISLMKSDIFSLTIPGKFQSYLASGKPIIGFIDGVVYDIIKKSDCGLVAHAEDCNELYDILVEFVKSSELDRSIMGKNGKDYFNREFSREELINRLINILNGTDLV